MNKIDQGFSISNIFTLFVRNIKIFLIVFLSILAIGSLIFGVINIAKYSAEGSVFVVTNVDPTSPNYEDINSNYINTITGLLTDDVVLKEPSKRSGLSLKELKDDIKFSVTGTMVKVVYEGGETLEECITTLDCIIDTWSNYVNQEDSFLTTVGGSLEIISRAKENSEPQTQKFIILAIVGFVGAIVAFFVAILKSIYSKRIIDETFVDKSFDKEVICALKLKNKEINKYHLQKLIYRIKQYEHKSVLFTGVNAYRKNELLSDLIAECKVLGINVSVINFDKNPIEGADNRVDDVYKSKEKISLELSGLNGADLVIVNANLANESIDALTLSGDVDAVLVGIEIPKTLIKDIKESVDSIEKVNENIYGVVYR